MFDLDRFIEDCRTSLADRSRQHTREIVARAVADAPAITARLGAPHRAGIDLLYRGDDMTIINITWGWRQITLPHSHNTWAVIGVYDGREDNIFWRRIPEATDGRIEAAGARTLCAGDVTSLGPDIIHCVTNPLKRITGAIHVYGGDFIAQERSQWDEETLREGKFDRKIGNLCFEEANARMGVA